MPLFHTFQKFLAIVYYSGLDHFPQKVISLTSSLAHSGKDRKSVMLLGYIVDQFLDKDRLADTCASEKSDLSALEIWLKQVNDLDTRKQDLL